MRVLELAVPREIVNDGDVSRSHGEVGSFSTGSPVRAGFRVSPFTGDLEVGGSASGSDSHVCVLTESWNQRRMFGYRENYVAARV